MQVQLFAFGCLVKCLVEHNYKRTAFLDLGEELFFDIWRQSKFSVTYLVLSFPQVNDCTSPESGNIALNTSSIPSLYL